MEIKTTYRIYDDLRFYMENHKTSEMQTIDCPDKQWVSYDDYKKLKEDYDVTKDLLIEHNEAYDRAN